MKKFRLLETFHSPTSLTRFCSFEADTIEKVRQAIADDIDLICQFGLGHDTPDNLPIRSDNDGNVICDKQLTSENHNDITFTGDRITFYASDNEHCADWWRRFEIVTA